MKALWYVILAVFATVLMSGCSSFQHRDQLALFNAAYVIGDYDAALKTVSFPMSENTPIDTQEHLLELMHQGEMYRLTERNHESTKAYDLVEEGMKGLDTMGLFASTAEGLMAVMVNDSERDYKALMSEAVLVNSYKGLAFLASGNSAYARVEFNRANDRTRRAVDYFRKDIVTQQAALKHEAEGGSRKASMIRDSLQSGSFQAAVDSHYGAPSKWSVFPEFIVPVSTYLHGLYFLANAEGGADYERAVTSLVRVADMSPQSTVLQADADLAEGLASGAQSLQALPPQIWIVYENGLGPVLRESRLDVPLVLTYGNQQVPSYFGIALPVYTDRSAVPGSIGALNASGQIVRTERISDMDKVVRTEMKERFSGILTRAVTSAISKAILQKEAAEQFGPVGQLVAAALTVATTQADLRSWQTLPDHWQAARIERPENGNLLLLDHQGEALGNLTIPQQPFTLVYVKRPTLQAPATVIVMDLQGGAEAAFARLPKWYE